MEFDRQDVQDETDPMIPTYQRHLSERASHFFKSLLLSLTVIPLAFWVCRYSPPGNWNVNNPGVLAGNVPPPCR